MGNGGEGWRKPIFDLLANLIECTKEVCTMTNFFIGPYGRGEPGAKRSRLRSICRIGHTKEHRFTERDP